MYSCTHTHIVIGFPFVRYCIFIVPDYALVNSMVRGPPSARPCSDDPDGTLAFCRALPKIELHAHINGCIRDETLNELCRACADPEVQKFVVSACFRGLRCASWACCHLLPRLLLTESPARRCRYRRQRIAA